MMSSFTVLFFLHASLYSPGAKSLGAVPFIQLQFQNDVVFPSPSCTMVLALKSCLSTSAHGGIDPTHGLSGSVHAYHSHRNLNALPKKFKSSTPNPPKFLGNIAFFHFTKQCPPFASSDPLQRKFLLNLSIFFIAHFFNGKTVKKYIGIAVRTDLTRVSLPALFNNFPFQTGNLAAILSSKGCTSILFRFLIILIHPWAYTQHILYPCVRQMTEWEQSPHVTHYAYPRTVYHGGAANLQPCTVGNGSQCR